MVLALLGSLVVGLAPAPAAAALTPTRPLNVLLLGDSYAAGNGARDVVGDRTYSGVEGCYRSTTNWAPQYVGLLRRSGDAPGGEEPAPDLDGDSTPARVTSFAPLNVRTSSTLLSDTDVDHVGFELDEPARVQALLGGLTADFDLAVLDRDGTLLALASQDTTRSERAVLDLPAGRYLLRVTARSGETSDRPYQLQATPARAWPAPPASRPDRSEEGTAWGCEAGRPRGWRPSP